MLTSIVSKIEANSTPMWLVTFPAPANTIIVILTKHTYCKRQMGEYAYTLTHCTSYSLRIMAKRQLKVTYFLQLERVYKT